MDKHQSYNDLIERKLAQLPGTDADRLWEGMHAILDQKMPQKKERRRFWGWLCTRRGLMLLAGVPALFVASYTVVAHFQRNSPATLQTAQTTKSATPATATILPITTGTARDIEAATGQETTTPLPLQGPERTTATVGTSFEAKQKSIASLKPTRSGAGKEGRSLPPASPATTDMNDPVLGEAQPESALTTAGSSPAQQPGGPATDNNPATAAATDALTAAAAATTDAPAAATEEPVAESTRQEAAAPAPAKERRRQDKGFYAGVVVGVDLSSVKWQSLSAGNSTGVLVGYSFHPRWSVESGLLWDKKKYASEGRYFRPDNYTPPSGTTILDVSGVCQMWEWPLNVRYNILTGEGRLFTTAGISSYYMKRESYNYHYEHNGVPGEYYAAYKNETQNWFSVANLSVGYSHQLGRIGALRVEPYLKLPLRELGIGKMPIVSTGLNVGFTKQLSR